MRTPLLVLAMALALSCGKHEPEPQDGGASLVVQALPPVPAPDGLVARVFIAAPDATWAKARNAIGGPAAFLPPSFGGLALTLLDLPITLTGEVDGTIPAVAAIVKGKDRPQIVVGLHVRAGDRFVDMATKGQDARFVAKLDPATSIVMLTPKESSGRQPPAIGVLGNYVIASRHAEDLAAVGPFVARTMPTETAPKNDVAMTIDGPALAGPLADALRDLTTRAAMANQNAAGSVMTTAFDKLAALLPDLANATATIDLDTALARIRIQANAKAGDGPASKALASMAAGDAAPLEELPSSALAGVVSRKGTSDDGDFWAAAEGNFIKQKLDGVPEAQRAKLDAALHAILAQHGAYSAFGVALAPTGPTVFGRAAILDKEKMQKALDDLAAAAKDASVVDALKKHDAAVSFGKTTIQNFPGDVRSIRFTRASAAAKSDVKKGSDANPTPDAIELDYLLTSDTFYGAAGYDPKDTLKTLVKPDKTLGAVAGVKSAIDAVGSDAAFVLFADPKRAFAAMGGSKPGAVDEPAPIVLAVAKKTSSPPAFETRLDVPIAAIQELVRRRGL